MASMTWDMDNLHRDRENPEMIWFSPDGVGRIWYDTLEEAESQTGLKLRG